MMVWVLGGEGHLESCLFCGLSFLRHNLGLVLCIWGVTVWGFLSLSSLKPSSVFKVQLNYDTFGVCVNSLESSVRWDLSNI